MSRDAALVCGEEIVTTEPRFREVVAQLAVDKVDVTKGPEIVTSDILFMQYSVGGLQIA